MPSRSPPRRRPGSSSLDRPLALDARPSRGARRIGWWAVPTDQAPIPRDRSINAQPQDRHAHLGRERQLEVAGQELEGQHQGQQERGAARSLAPRDDPGQAPGPGHPAPAGVAPLVRQVDHEEAARRPGEGPQRRPDGRGAEPSRRPVRPQPAPDRVPDQARRVGGLERQQPVEEPVGGIEDPHLALGQAGEAVPPEVVPERQATRRGSPATGRPSGRGRTASRRRRPASGRRGRSARARRAAPRPPPPGPATPPGPSLAIGPPGPRLPASGLPPDCSFWHRTGGKIYNPPAEFTRPASAEKNTRRPSVRESVGRVTTWIDARPSPTPDRPRPWHARCSPWKYHRGTGRRRPLDHPECSQGGASHVGPEQEARSTVPGRARRPGDDRQDRPQLGPDRDRGPRRRDGLPRGDRPPGRRAADRRPGPPEGRADRATVPPRPPPIAPSTSPAGRSPDGSSARRRDPPIPSVPLDASRGRLETAPMRYPGRGVIGAGSRFGRSGPVAMKVVVAPDKFKGSLSAPEAARAMARGVRAASPVGDGRRGADGRRRRGDRRGPGGRHRRLVPRGGRRGPARRAGPRAVRPARRRPDRRHGDGRRLGPGARAPRPPRPDPDLDPRHRRAAPGGRRGGGAAGDRRHRRQRHQRRRRRARPGARLPPARRRRPRARPRRRRPWNGSTGSTPPAATAASTASRWPSPATSTTRSAARRGASAVYGPQKGADPAMVAALDRNLDRLRPRRRARPGRRDPRPARRRRGRRARRRAGGVRLGAAGAGRRRWSSGAVGLEGRLRGRRPLPDRRGGARRAPAPSARRPSGSPGSPARSAARRSRWPARSARGPRPCWGRGSTPTSASAPARWRSTRPSRAPARSWSAPPRRRCAPSWRGDGPSEIRNLKFQI